MDARGRGFGGAKFQSNILKNKKNNQKLWSDLRPIFGMYHPKLPVFFDVAPN